MKIPTRYDTQEELILDLNILGKILQVPSQTIEELTTSLKSEYKMKRPMPTLEQKRYEISSGVASDYEITNEDELVLGENESLIDLTVSQDDIPDIDESIIEVDTEKRVYFHYENQVTPSMLEEFLNGDYHRFTGNLSNYGTNKVDTSHELSDEQIDDMSTNMETWGSDGLEFDTTSYDTEEEMQDSISKIESHAFELDDGVELEEQEVESTTEEPVIIEKLDLSGTQNQEAEDDIEFDEGFGIEDYEYDGGSSDLEEYEEEGTDKEIDEDDSDEFDSDEDDEFDSDEEEFDSDEEEFDSDEEEFDSDEDEEIDSDEFDLEEDEDVDEGFDDESDEYDDSDAFDTNSDEFDDDEDSDFGIEDYEESDEDYTEEGDSEEYEDDEESDDDFFDDSEDDEESDDGLFDDSEDDDMEDAFVEDVSESEHKGGKSPKEHELPPETTKKDVIEDSELYDSMFVDTTEVPVKTETKKEEPAEDTDNFIAKIISDKSLSDKQKQEIIANYYSTGKVTTKADFGNIPIQNEPPKEKAKEEEESYKSIRQYVRKHPRCSVSDVLQYFSRAELEKEIMIGRVIRKGNILHI